MIFLCFLFCSCGQLLLTYDRVVLPKVFSDFFQRIMLQKRWNQDSLLSERNCNQNGNLNLNTFSNFWRVIWRDAILHLSKHQTV